MNKKNVQILIVVICFAGAGYVLYNGFHSSSPGSASKATLPPTNTTAGAPGVTPAGVTTGNVPSGTGAGASAAAPLAAGASPTGASMTGVSTSDKILPNGETFNVDKVFTQYNFQFGAYTYPVISTSTDIGLDLKNIIKPEEKSDKSGGATNVK